MAIDVTGNTVNFGTYTISVTPTSLIINGKLRAAGCAVLPTQAQGSVSGYISGGEINGTPRLDSRDKFPFTSDTNATDVGEIPVAANRLTGQSSSTSGYISGGDATPGELDTILKFPFSLETNIVDVGELVSPKRQAVGVSSVNSGYVVGGPSDTTLQKFPFSSDSPAVDVGELTFARAKAASQASLEFGYATGGSECSSPSTNNRTTSHKFPFASDTPVGCIGMPLINTQDAAGQSSIENGYVSGGAPISPTFAGLNSIYKFPFASEEDESDIGDLVSKRRNVVGHSSTTSGYTVGGADPTAPAGTQCDMIDKFPFSSDANASDVGNLVQGRYSSSPQQV